MQLFDILMWLILHDCPWKLSFHALRTFKYSFFLSIWNAYQYDSSHILISRKIAQIVFETALLVPFINLPDCSSRSCSQNLFNLFLWPFYLSLLILFIFGLDSFGWCFECMSELAIVFFEVTFSFSTDLRGYLVDHLVLFFHLCWNMMECYLPF